jgi:hypothetical protein
MHRILAVRGAKRIRADRNVSNCWWPVASPGVVSERCFAAGAPGLDVEAPYRNPTRELGSGCQ